MNIEEIKVGETYNVRVKVECIDEDGWFKVRTSEKAISFVLSPKEQEAFSLLPKYDPCRKFKKGDLVRLKAYNGRKPYDFWHKQTIEHFGAKLDTVFADELDSGNVDIFQDAPIDELTVRVHASHLELVTPVEELEPYSVGVSNYKGFVNIEKNGKIIAMLPYGKELHEYKTEAEALAAAEAERDRLNAEYRKEMEK